jgi:probable addiction module antidote protein
MFRRDPKFAAEYLSHVLAEGDETDLMLALRHIANAFGGIATVAKRAELNATSLYRTLSPKGNPELKTLTAVLKALGMRLAIVPEKRRRAA